MKLTRRLVKRGRVEIIPMIDTILILLIFYMSFSTFSSKEKRMEARLPEYPQSKVGELAAPPPPTLTLHVRNTAVVVNGSSYDLPTLLETLKILTASAPGADVIIEADADTRYQAIVSAVDACAQAKLARVAFRPLES